MQRQEDLIVGLDIGTTKICAVVGEVSGSDINIIGMKMKGKRENSRGEKIMEKQSQ